MSDSRDHVAAVLMGVLISKGEKGVAAARRAVELADLLMAECDGSAQAERDKADKEKEKSDAADAERLAAASVVEVAAKAEAAQAAVQPTRAPDGSLRPAETSTPVYGTPPKDASIPDELPNLTDVTKDESAAKDGSVAGAVKKVAVTEDEHAMAGELSRVSGVSVSDIESGAPIGRRGR